MLELALSASEEELAKMLEIVLAIMIESKSRDQFIGVILEMEGQEQEEMKCMVHSIIKKQQQEQPVEGNEQTERSNLMDKIDELE